MTSDEWDDFLCELYKNPQLRNLEATEEDLAEWMAGGKSLLDYCVCHVEGRRDHCRFHTGGTVHEGPHNLLPVLGYPELVKIAGLFMIVDNDGKKLVEIDRDGNKVTTVVAKLSELEKARLYKALYDDGMRIDRVVRILKEEK